MKSFCMFIIAMAVAFGSTTQGQAQATITISSSAFKAGEMIPAQHTCKGANQNPPLQFKGIPAGAKSLVLITDDPDAPGGVFNHWLLWNIDPATTQIGANSVPTGAVQGQNDFGQPGYGGPCPPSGAHRYFFRLFALDRKLALKPGAKRSALDRALTGHTIATGELMGRYGR